MIQFHAEHLDAKAIRALAFAEMAILPAQGNLVAHAGHEARVFGSAPSPERQ